MKKEELKSTREGFGVGLVEAGEKNPDVVVLTADLKESTRVSRFAEQFPNRFFDVGVAEQALVTIASGMANYGKIPVLTSFAVFAPGRCLEQIRTTIAMNNLPVIIVGGHTGLSAGADGATHQALEDIAIMRTLPNMMVISPCDFFEAKKAIIGAVKLKRPVYLRLERDPTLIMTTQDSPFKIGKCEIVWDPMLNAKSQMLNIAIVATGPIVAEALKAARKLDRICLSTMVINCHTIKPIDEQAIIHAAKIAGAVVTVEVHQKAGGLGSAVAEVLSQYFPVPIEIMGVDDCFGESGKPQELLKKHKITAEDISIAAKKAIRRKQAD